MQAMPETMPVLKEPKPTRHTSRKLLLLVLLLFLVLVAVLFFYSPISKISSITITGQQYMTSVEIAEASGLQVNDPFFGISSSQLEERIRELQTIEKVHVTKRFPGEVFISVQEYPPVAYQLSEEGHMTAILSSGTRVFMQGRDYIVDKPVLTGWAPGDPLLEELSKVLGSIPARELSDFSEIVPDPSTSYPDRIRIYTRTQFEVQTTISLLAQKLPTLQAVVETQQPGRVTLLLADTYVPFEQHLSENEDINTKVSTQ